MGKKIRNLLLIFVALAVVGGALTFALMMENPDEESDFLIDTEDFLNQNRVITKEATDVSKFTVKNEKSAFTVTSTGEEPVEGLEIALFEIAELKGLLSSFALDDLSRLTYELRWVDKIEEETDDFDFKKAGLDKPKSTLSITYADKSETEIKFGELSPDGNGRYFVISGDETIYLASPAETESVLYSLYDFVDRIVVDAEIYFGTGEDEPDTEETAPENEEAPAISIESLEVTDTAGNIKSRLTKNPNHESTGHIDILKNNASLTLEYPMEAPLDEEKTTELVNSLPGMYAYKVMEIHPDDKMLNEYKLDKADTFTVKTTKGILKLRVGKKFSITEGEGENEIKTTCYAVLNEDIPVIFAMGEKDFILGRYNHNDLLTAYLMTVMIYDIKTIRARLPNAVYDMELQGDDYSEDFYVKINGENIDPDRFKDYYKTVLNFSPLEVYTEELTDNTGKTGKPEVTLTYKYKEKDKADDVVEFYRVGVRKVVMKLNGKSAFLSQESQFNKFVEHTELIYQNRDYE